MEKGCDFAANCPEAQRPRGCYEDTHHEVYPAAEYRSRLEKQYRELQSLKEVMCRRLHNQTHAETGPPEKPTAAEMRAAIIAEGRRIKQQRLIGSQAVGGAGNAE
jgi:hypothetical protein